MTNIVAPRFELTSAATMVEVPFWLDGHLSAQFDSSSYFLCFSVPYLPRLNDSLRVPVGLEGTNY